MNEELRRSLFWKIVGWLFFLVLSAGGAAAGSDAKFRLAIDTIRAVPGTSVELGINNLVDAMDSSLANGKSVGGFSLLFSYDCACLQFLSARKGASWCSRAGNSLPIASVH